MGPPTFAPDNDFDVDGLLPSTGAPAGAGDPPRRRRQVIRTHLAATLVAQDPSLAGIVFDAAGNPVGAAPAAAPAPAPAAAPVAAPAAAPVADPLAATVRGAIGEALAAVAAAAAPPASASAPPAAAGPPPSAEGGPSSELSELGRTPTPPAPLLPAASPAAGGDSGGHDDPGAAGADVDMSDPDGEPSPPGSFFYFTDSPEVEMSDRDDEPGPPAADPSAPAADPSPEVEMSHPGEEEEPSAAAGPSAEAGPSAGGEPAKATSPFDWEAEYAAAVRWEEEEAAARLVEMARSGQGEETSAEAGPSTGGEPMRWMSPSTIERDIGGGLAGYTIPAAGPAPSAGGEPLLSMPPIDLGREIAAGADYDTPEAGPSSGGGPLRWMPPLGMAAGPSIGGEPPRRMSPIDIDREIEAAAAAGAYDEDEDEEYDEDEYYDDEVYDEVSESGGLTDDFVPLPRPPMFPRNVYELYESLAALPSAATPLQTLMEQLDDNIFGIDVTDDAVAVPQWAQRHEVWAVARHAALLGPPANNRDDIVATLEMPAGVALARFWQHMTPRRQGQLRDLIGRRMFLSHSEHRLLFAAAIVRFALYGLFRGDDRRVTVANLLGRVEDEALGVSDLVWDMFVLDAEERYMVEADGLFESIPPSPYYDRYLDRARPH